MACEPFFDGCLMRTPPADSCSRAADAAELVVQASVASLAPFFCPGSRCPTVVGMVTHGPPDVTNFSFVAAWVEEVSEVLREATLPMPADSAYVSTGSRGQHSEHMGFVLAEMQSLQRAYPGGRW